MSKEETTKLYERYLTMPLASNVRGNSDTPRSELYDKHYVVHTGKAVIYPHPHRYFTQEEFETKLNEDKEFEKFCSNLPSSK